MPRYIRADDRIILSSKATHKLIEDICCACYFTTLKKGAYVRIGEKWLNFYGNWVDIIDEKDNHYSIRPDEVNRVTKELPQADTIKELCNEFVLKGIGVIFINKDNTQYRFGGESVWHDITDTQIKIGVYGAIWTDKGLIYVAKMNEQGEWVLTKDEKEPEDDKL